MIKNEKNSTWKKHRVPRGKHHNKTATKTTISVYLNRKLVERARNRRLNLSRVTENALLSILDYLEPQKPVFSLSKGSLFGKRESLVDGTGFEPAASTMPTWRSYQADLPAQYMIFLNSYPQH